MMEGEYLVYTVLALGKIIPSFLARRLTTDVQTPPPSLLWYSTDVSSTIDGICFRPSARTSIIRSAHEQVRE